LWGGALLEFIKKSPQEENGEPMKSAIEPRRGGKPGQKRKTYIPVVEKKKKDPFLHRINRLPRGGWQVPEKGRTPSI